MLECLMTVSMVYSPVKHKLLNFLWLFVPCYHGPLQHHQLSSPWQQAVLYNGPWVWMGIEVLGWDTWEQFLWRGLNSKTKQEKKKRKKKVWNNNNKNNWIKELKTHDRICSVLLNSAEKPGLIQYLLWVLQIKRNLLTKMYHLKQLGPW